MILIHLCCFHLIVDTLFDLGIVVCDGFIVPSVGSWNWFRVFVCFCTALLPHVLSSNRVHDSVW